MSRSDPPSSSSLGRKATTFMQQLPIASDDLVATFSTQGPRAPELLYDLRASVRDNAVGRSRWGQPQDSEAEGALLFPGSWYVVQYCNACCRGRHADRTVPRCG